MDAFYASVEVLADPSLAGRPVIVGGTGNRGVVASCSYEARAAGVRSAMPTSRARSLCPHAVLLPADFDRYRDVSRRLHRILGSYTPLVEGIALDEAFLDVSGGSRLWGSGADIARALRRRVADELGLSASVGVATTKLVAKLASDAAKPAPSPGGPLAGAGVKVVAPGEELGFLHPLPVSALWGVGPATGRRLGRLGVRTIGDLARLPLDALVGALGANAGRSLYELAWGRDDRPVEPDRPARSLGHERTFERDRSDAGELRREASRLSMELAGRLRDAGTAGRTVVVKIRFADFRTVTRSRTVATTLDTGTAIGEVACQLLAGVDTGAGVRLLGVSLTGLEQRCPEQLALGEEVPEAGDRRLESALDQVRRRFGRGVVGPASTTGAAAGSDIPGR